MNRSIKTRLLVAFFLVNAVFIANGVALFAMNNYTVGEYARVVGTMSAEYQLSEAVNQLIETYNELVLGNSVTVAKGSAKLQPIKLRITQQLQYLDGAVVDSKAKLSFAGLKNSIDQAIKEVDVGLEDVANDRPTAFAHYQAAHHFYDFVQSNSTTFTFDQLRYIDSIEKQLRATDTALNITAISLLVLVAVGSAVYSLRFARSLVVPLRRLTFTATDIAGDNMKAQFDPGLLRRPDEIGSLSNSFNTMFQRLKGKLKELEVEKNEAEGERAKDDAILNSIGDGMIATDRSGNILLINDIAAYLLGIDRKTAAGHSAFKAYQLLDEANNKVPQTSRPLHIALSSGQKTVQTLRSVKKDGTSINVALTATPVIQQGVIIGAIEIVRDITKEKEVDRMKTEFISLASHQLRTPLSAIKWFTEMLLAGDAGKLSTEQTEFERNVSESVERMIELVNALLNISRIESGRIIVDPKPTDVRELVQGIINDLKAKTSGRQQQLTVNVDKDLPKINLDPRLIGQVYLNLLTNSIKYTHSGGVITVTITRQGNDVVSQVTDNGCGVPLAEQPKMFQKFFRASNVVKFETDGTGLGMYLVKSIVESSGGRVWFESVENKGTTFWFTLPLAGMKAKKGEVTLEV